MSVRKRLLAILCLVLFLLMACGRSDEEKTQIEEVSTQQPLQYNDHELIGTVADFLPDGQSFYVNHAEWLQRHTNGEGTDEGHGFHAIITEETVLKFENGEPAELKDFKPGQKIKVLPPTEEDLPIEVDEITILEMSYEEKYERFLAHPGIDYRIVVLYEEGNTGGLDVEKIFGRLSEDLKLNAAQFPYPENEIVDYKKELGIEKLPVILVFDSKGLLFKTYEEKEVYEFFDELKK